VFRRWRERTAAVTETLVAELPFPGLPGHTDLLLTRAQPERAPRWSSGSGTA